MYVEAIYIALASLGLRKHVKFDQPYLSEKVTFNVFTRYEHKLLSIFTDYKVSEGLRQGPEFSYNYTVGYHIIVT